MIIRLRAPGGSIVSASEEKAERLRRIGFTTYEEEPVPAAPKRRGRPKKVVPKEDA